MNLVHEARQWLENELPTSMEVQESIDNTCHLLAQPITAEKRDELNKVIDVLMGSLQGVKIEIVRPEPPTIRGIDSSPLIPDSTPDTPPISSEERRRRFEELKVSGLDRPF